MTGTITIPQNEVEEILSAVLKYNGIETVSVVVSGGAECEVTVPPIQVKTAPDDQDRLRDMLYPEVDTSWKFQNRT